MWIFIMIHVRDFQVFQSTGIVAVTESDLPLHRYSEFMTTILINKHWYHQVDKTFYLGANHVTKPRSIVLAFLKTPGEYKNWS